MRIKRRQLASRLAGWLARRWLAGFKAGWLQGLANRASSKNSSVQLQHAWAGQYRQLCPGTACAAGVASSLPPPAVTSCELLQQRVTSRVSMNNPTMTAYDVL